jgi:hypothetical protein
MGREEVLQFWAEQLSRLHSCYESLGQTARSSAFLLSTLQALPEAGSPQRENILAVLRPLLEDFWEEVENDAAKNSVRELLLSTLVEAHHSSRAV